MSQNKSSFQNVLKGGGLVSVGMLVNNVLQLVSGILVVRVLSVEQYGDFALGNATISLLNVLCLVGIPTVMVKFAVQSRRDSENSLDAISKVISSSFFIVGLTSCLAILLVISTAGIYARTVSSANLALVLSVLILTLPFTNSVTLFSSYFRFRNNPAPKVIFQDIVFNTTRAVLLLVAMLTALSLAGVLVLYVISSLFTALLFGLYFYKNKNMAMRLRPDRSTIKKLLLGGLPVLGVALIPSMETWLVSSITSFYHSADVLAIFSAPNRLSAFLTMPLTAMGFLYLPILSEFSKKTDRDQINSLYQSVTKWTVLVSVPIFVYVFVEAEFIVRFLFGENYSQSADVLRLIAVGACINTFFGNNYLTLVVLGGGKVLLVSSIVSVLVMATVGILVIPEYGYIGAAIALVAAKTALNLIMSWYLYQRYRVFPCSIGMIWAVLVASACVLAYGEVLQLFSKDLVLFLLYAPVAFFIVLFVPRYIGGVSDSDAQIYSSIDGKIGALLKKVRLR